MTGRYSDYEELRPLGEATHIPDDTLSSSTDGEPRRQRTGETHAGYPDDTTATAAECVSCGTSIPTGQTKCRFCLTNHLDAATDGQDTPDSECDILHIIHALVESPTFYGAVAKGAAATNLLAKGGSDPAVDDCQLIYDLDEEPAAQFADQWPAIPSAARVSSECGQQLLKTARERTTWGGAIQAHHNGEHATYLYDETGRGLRLEKRLTTFLKNAENGVWMVPAIALQRSAGGNSRSQQHRIPTQDHLSFRECDRDVDHRFREFEEVPDEEWSGQPMWECQECGTLRYGPQPGEERQSNSADAVSAPSG